MILSDETLRLNFKERDGDQVWSGFFSNKLLSFWKVQSLDFKLKTRKRATIVEANFLFEFFQKPM